jgi:hypothetical protein
MRRPPFTTGRFLVLISVRSRVSSQDHGAVGRIRTNKLHALSPRANYTDRETVACRRSDCQLFGDKGCHVVRVTDPFGLNLGFLDRSRYFSIK